MARPTQIAVCAPGTATDEELTLAGAVGRLLGERGCTLVCGGLGGAMAAASRAAKEAGGLTIGIIPGYDERAANPWIDHVICTGIGQARNVLVVASGHAVIAVGGGWGTLSEIAIALRLGRPVVLLGGWSGLLASDAWQDQVAETGSSVTLVETAEAAVEAALSAANQSPPSTGAA